MNRVHNIFYGVINSENSMTELLCNFMIYKPFRDDFIRLFYKGDTNKISFDDFQTQYTTDVNQSRPDMVISNDDCEFIIEIKTWNTELTNNQPISYMEYLKKVDKQNKCLIFLVPSNYIHLNEWQNKADAWSKDNKCKLLIKTIFWDEIIKVIEQNDLNLISDRFRDFNDLLKLWFEIEPIKFNKAEVDAMYSSEIPKVLIKMFRIIDEAKDYYSQKYIVSKSMIDEEYALYIKRREDKANLLYLGIWYPFWEEYGFPLCYGVNIDQWPKNIVEKFSAANKGKTIEFNGYRVAYIDKNIFNDEKCSQRIVDIVGQQLDMLI